MQRQRTNEERCAELLVRSQTATVELQQAEERLRALGAERDQNRQVVANATAEVESARQQVAEKQQQAEAAAAALAQVEIEQERRRVATMEALAQESAIHNRITRAQERISGLERELARLNAEIASGAAQVEAFGGQRGQIAFAFESASNRAAALASQIDDTRRQLEEKRAAGERVQTSPGRFAGRVRQRSGPEELAGGGDRRARVFHRIGAAAAAVGIDAGRLCAGGRAGRLPGSR